MPRKGIGIVPEADTLFQDGAIFVQGHIRQQAKAPGAWHELRCSGGNRNQFLRSVDAFVYAARPHRSGVLAFVHICAYHCRCRLSGTKPSRANLAKHGVDFADAAAVFEDDLALTRPDLDSRGEGRSVILGVDGFGRHLIVVFMERGTRIRIVSARLATKQERKSYED